MFQLLDSKLQTISLIKADDKGTTALHAICCNPHFTDDEKIIDYFKSCIKWLKEKGISYCNYKIS